MKLISPQVIHKTDIGGIKVINSSQEARQFFDKTMKITKSKSATIHTGIWTYTFI